MKGENHGPEKKWSSSAKFEIALQAVKGDKVVSKIFNKFKKNYDADTLMLQVNKTV